MDDVRFPLFARSQFEGPMSTTTIFPGKLLGLYLIAISIGMFVGRRRTLATLDEIARSGPWMLFSGMVATAAGLVVVLAHDVWSAGMLAIAVTLVGWMALLKGLALLMVPPSRMASAYKSAGFERTSTPGWALFWRSGYGWRGTRSAADGSPMNRTLDSRCSVADEAPPRLLWNRGGPGPPTCKSRRGCKPRVTRICMAGAVPMPSDRCTPSYVVARRPTRNVRIGRAEGKESRRRKKERRMASIKFITQSSLRGAAIEKWSANCRI